MAVTVKKVVDVSSKVRDVLDQLQVLLDDKQVVLDNAESCTYPDEARIERLQSQVLVLEEAFSYLESASDTLGSYE